MIWSIILLACSLSIDSVGIGISYGIRKIKIPFSAELIMCAVSFMFTSAAVFFGDVLLSLIPGYISKYIGAAMLMLLGIYMLAEAFRKEKNSTTYKLKKKGKIKSFLSSLKLSIKILKKPECGDFDKSNCIDGFEALYLGLTLSLDSLCAGFGFAVSGASSFLLPFFVSLFQLIFLTLGSFLASKIPTFKHVKQNFFVIICAAVLMLIAILRCI